MNTKGQELAMEIIANAGDAKSCAAEAVDVAIVDGDLDEAKKLLKEAQDALLKSHKAHTDLIVEDAREPMTISMLLVHASNHVTAAEAEVSLADTVIKLLEMKKEK